MKKVGFGTDGWRGVIADGFTTGNLETLTQAVMSYLKGRGGPEHLFIGYDTRFMSEHYARLAACVAAGNGYRVSISPSCITSPMLSHAVSAHDCSGGLMVTASHNPCRYNGLKFKAPFGGSAYPDITSGIESFIGAGPVVKAPFEDAFSRGEISETDFFGPYSRDVYKMLDLDAIRHGAPKAVFDCMHGAAGTYAERMWGGAGLELKTLRASRDPYFGGMAPEPVECNLAQLTKEVVENGYGVGFATDGDGDRLAVVDSSGGFVGAHRILSLLLLHLHRRKGMSGAVVKTVSTSSIVDRVASGLGLPVIETPVGFKHICEVMLGADVLIGGEENGGLGVKGFIPERDGFLGALLVLEMLAMEGKTMEELSAGMDERYGRLYYRRYDAETEGRFDKPRFEEFGGGLGRLFRDFGGMNINRLDGFKAVFGDGSWILFRLSGTEPLVRIYAESPEETKVERLMYRAKEALHG